MDVRSCEKCRRLFKSQGKDICPECIVELERQFEIVKAKLYKTPNSSIEELCEESGAEEGDILGWLREGRLTVGTDSRISLKCSVCGKRIEKGRYCEECTRNMVEELEKSVDAIKKENANVLWKNNDNTDRSSMNKMYIKDNKGR